MVISKLKIGTYLLFVVIGIGIGYLIFANKTERITTPPIYGEFKPAIPISQKPIGEPLVVTWRTEKEIIYVETEGEVNDSLIKAYAELKEKYNADSLELERFKMFVDLATYREFTHTFEDEYLKARIKGLTLGYIKNVSIPEYEIKSQEVDVPTYYRILAGMEFGNNTLLNDFRYKVNAGLQTPKGITYRAAYSKQGAIDYVWLGADFEVFKF